MRTLAKRWRFIRVVLSWTESNLDTEVIGFASHNKSSPPPTFPYQVFSTIPVKVSFLSLFSLFLGKRKLLTQMQTCKVLGEGDFFIVTFLMVTRLLLQNNQVFQQVNSSSLYLSSLLKLLCLPLFFYHLKADTAIQKTFM